MYQTDWQTTPSIPPSLAFTDPAVRSWLDRGTTIPLWQFAVLGLLLATIVLWISLRERRRFAGLRIAIRLALILMLLVAAQDWVRRQWTVQLPDLVIAVDQSLSMNSVDAHDRSPLALRVAAALEKASGELNRMDFVRWSIGGQRAEQLQRRYQLRFYSIGDGAFSLPGDTRTEHQALGQLQPRTGASRLGDDLNSILNRQRGRRTAAVILLSDGAVTSGKPLATVASQARTEQIPFYCVGVGRTGSPRDVALLNLQVNDVVFLNDRIEFPFELTAHGVQGEAVRVVLRSLDQPTILDEQSIEIDNNLFQRNLILAHTPATTGVMHYEIVAETVTAENNVQNNRLQKQVEIRDKTISVLLVDRQPSVEFRFVKHTLARLANTDRSQAVEVSTLLLSADPRISQIDDTAITVFPVTGQELNRFDVVILFEDVIAASGIPAGGLRQTDLENLRRYVADDGGCLVWIARPGSMPKDRHGLQSLLPFTDLPSGAAPLRWPFDQPHQLVPTNLSTTFAPLARWAAAGQSKSGPLSVYWYQRVSGLKPGAVVMAEFQGAGEPRFPAIVLQRNGAGISVFHCTDEFYRWRFRSEAGWFDDYWSELVRYLARQRLHSADRQACLFADRTVYGEADPIQLSATIFDQSLWNEAAPPVIELEDSGGTRQRFTLTPAADQAQRFNCLIPPLVAGEYRVDLVGGASEIWASYGFRVEAVAREMLHTQLDDASLKQLASDTSGQYFSLDQLEQVWTSLPVAETVWLSESAPSPYWSRWPVVAVFALVFVVLLSTEWILRKLAGLL